MVRIVLYNNLRQVVDALMPLLVPSSIIWYQFKNWVENVTL